MNKFYLDVSISFFLYILFQSTIYSLSFSILYFTSRRLFPADAIIWILLQLISNIQLDLAKSRSIEGWEERDIRVFTPSSSCNGCYDYSSYHVPPSQCQVSLGSWNTISSTSSFNVTGVMASHYYLWVPHHSLFIPLTLPRMYISCFTGISSCE